MTIYNEASIKIPKVQAWVASRLVNSGGARKVIGLESMDALHPVPHTLPYASLLSGCS